MSKPNVKVTNFDEQSIPGISIPAHDHVQLNPPAQPTTITYRKGGPSGTVVATLTLTYSGADLASVTRS